MSWNASSFAHHEKFEELAALAAVGELGEVEMRHLRQHLADCFQCRDSYEAFADLGSNALGGIAADRESLETASVSGLEDAEVREKLQQFRSRKLETPEREQSHGWTSVDIKAHTNGHGRPTYRRIAFALSATFLLAAFFAGGIWWRHSAKLISEGRSQLKNLQAAVDSLKRKENDDRANANTAAAQALQESQETRDALQKALIDSEAKNNALLERQKASEEKLASAIANAEQLRQQLATKDIDRERLEKLQQESEAKLHEALVELYQARQSSAQTAANTDTSEANSASGTQSSDAATATVSPSETEARNLFGARDLHIVDVYDVNGAGKTKRTYGRVYYVEKKLLVFYAFDLQNRQSHRRGTFQAWGYREANVGKPLNLGLFTIDDGPTSRWVLTVNRPDVLAHIDAVFVTVEPPGGSTAPSGKKVLYANLVGPPNHP